MVRKMAAAQLPCKSVILTAAVRDAGAQEAVRLGAKGLVLKESPPEAIVDCVRSVYRGETFFEKDTAERTVGAPGGDAAGELTPREIEIVRMVGQGLRNKAIAERLSISEGTVKVHLHNIYEKLGIEGD